LSEGQGGVLLPEFYGDRIKTAKGQFIVVFTNNGIFEICFPGFTPAQEYQDHELPWPNLTTDLQRYLAGRMVSWEGYPLDNSGYTPFTAALLDKVGSIPYGQVCTYREIAEQAGSPLAWRAAGQALKANRHPIIVPCHRVVGSGGKPGGFSGPSGWKQMLLQLERAI